MKSINCSACRKKIYREAEEAYLKNEFAYFENAAYSMAIFATIAALSVQHRRGRSAAYIRKFFDEMCFIFDYPEFFGKRLDMIEMKQFFENRYGIDFNKIKLHLESEKEFIHDVKKGDLRKVGEALELTGEGGDPGD